MSLAFFLIVPSVMGVSALLIRALAKRLGLKIYYSTLAATALLSFIVIFSAVFLSHVPDKKFLLYLGILILSASALLTAINNFLIKKQRDEERDFTEQVKAAYAEELKKDSAKSVVEEIVAPVDKFEWGDENSPVEEKVSAPVEETAAAELVEEKFSQLVEDTVAAEAVKENSAIEITEKAIESIESSALQEDFPLEKVFKPLAEVKAEAVAKVLENKDSQPFEEPKPEENFPLLDAFKPLDKAKSEAVEKALNEEDSQPFEEPKPEENFPLQETFKPLEKVKLEALEEISKPTAELSGLDPVQLEEEIAKPTVEESATLEQPQVEEIISKSTVEESATVEQPQVEEIISKPTVEESATIEQQVEEIISKLTVEESATVEQPQVEEIISKPTVEESATVEQPQVEEIISKATVENSATLEQPQVEEIISKATVEESATLEQPQVEEIISKSTVEESATLEQPQVEEKVETLDDILDRAYDARDKGHIWKAIEQYRKALERYSTDEYAPFVAIDLGNLYKENALYPKAIKVYEEAMNLPAVKRNPSTKKEFVKTLEYLRVVRDILLKHHISSTPFGKLPKEILQEIDVEFQKTQLHSAQYK